MLLSSVLSWRVSRLGTLVRYNGAQELEACDCLKLLSIHFDLYVDHQLDSTGVVCHQVDLLGTDFHAVGCAVFVKTLS